MAKFSQGFLSGISDFGKMDPSQPQRRLAQAAPQYKQMGTTDPLARRVGSLFGNLGIDTSYMQTGEERAGAAMAEAGKGQFASPEGRMIAMLEAQLPTLRPQAQMEAVEKIRQLRVIEQTRKIEAEQQQQNKTAKEVERATISGLIYAKGNEALAAAISNDVSGDATKAGIEILKKDAMESDNPLDRFKVVGNNIYDTVDEKFIVPPKNAKDQKIVNKEFFNPETNQNEIQYYYENEPETIILSKPAPKSADASGRESVRLLRERSDLIKEYDTLSQSAERAENLANELSSINPEGGLYSDVNEWLKKVAGAQDKVSLLRTEASRLVTGNAIRNLPRGPASDRDVALVLQGELPANANAETLAQYARGVAKLQRREAQYKYDQSLWLDKYDSYRGFTASQTVKKVEEQFLSTPSAAIEFIKENRNNPEFRVAFKSKYKYDYFQYEKELQDANDVLKGIKK